MADEVVRGVVSLSVEGLNAVKQAADALDQFSTLSTRAAREQAQGVEQMAKSLGLLGSQASQVDRLAASTERLAAAEARLVTGRGGYAQRGNYAAAETGLPTNAIGSPAVRAADEQAAVRDRAAYNQAVAADYKTLATARSRFVVQQQRAMLDQTGAANEVSNLMFEQARILRENIRSQIRSSGAGGGIISGGGGIYGGGYGDGGGYNGGAYNRISGAAGDFQRGFRGLRDRPYAEQLGQTFKFATFYGGAYSILYTVSQAFSNAAQEAVKFQDALNELNIVTGRNAKENLALADSLGQIAARTGASPSEGVAAGARAIGLFGLTTADQATQAAAARAATTTAAQINLGSGRSFDQIQADIGAIAQAYGTGYQGQSRIADLDAYITRRFGVTVGNSLETTAQVGTLASAQGFSLADQTAIAAALQARTGQSPAAIAGFLSQIYGKGSDTRLQTELQGVGVTPNRDLKSQLQQLVDLRAQGKVTDDQLNAIADKVSKGKAGNAFRALIEDYDRIIKAANDADQNAQGAAAKQAATRLSNTAGQLQQLQGAVAEFGKDFLSSGIIEGFGLLAASFGHALNALDPLLQAFNALPDPIRYVTLALIAMQIAAKSFGGYNASFARIASSGPTNLIGRAEQAGYTVTQNALTRKLEFIPVSQAVRSGPNLRAYEFLNPAQQKAAGLDVRPYTVAREARNIGGFGPATEGLPSVVGVGARAAGIGRFGALGLAAGAAGAELLATLVNPITLAIGGFIAVGAIKGKMDELSQAVDDATPALATLAKAKSAEDYKNAANAISASAKAVSEGRSGADGFFAGTFNPQSAVLEKTLYGQAAYATAAGKALATQEAQAAALKDITIFGDPATRTIENITNALQTLATGGASAAVQLRLLYGALTPQTVRSNFIQPIPRASVATSLSTALANNNFAFQQVPNFLYPGGTPGKGGGVFTGPGNPFATQTAPPTVRSDVLASLLPQQQERIFNAINTSLPKTAKGGLLSPEQIATVGTAVVNSLGTDITSIDGAKEQIAAFVTQYLSGRHVGAVAGANRLSPDELFQQVVTAIKPQFEQTISDIAALGDPAKAIPEYTKLINSVKALIASTDYSSPDDISQVLQFLHEAMVKKAEAEVQQYEGFRKGEQARAKSKKQIAAIGQKYFTLEGTALANAGDVQGLTAMMDNANRGAIAGLIADLKASAALKRQAAIDAARIAAASLAARVALAAATTNPAGENSGSRSGTPSAAKAASDAAAAAAKQADQAVAAALAAATSSTAPAKGGAMFTGSDSGNPLSNTGGSTTPKETAAQIAAARQTALAIRSGGGVAAATAAISTAAADLAVAKKNTVAYYQALGQYFTAQQSLKDALAAYQNNQALLGIDQTDPVAMANEKLAAAQRKLVADQKAKKDKDVIAQDQLDVRSAQTDAESAKFNQRLQDAQIADRLGRSSHAAYIQYLENEHKRLQSIGHRTRQQQDELDQIDGLLKDAQTALQGQFNLGNIKLPTPYEVRRYIQTQAAGMAYQAGQTGAVSTTTIQIDGADTGMILRILSQYLGSSATLTTGTSTAKV